MTKSRSVIAWKEGGERRKGVMDLFVFLIVVIVSKAPTCQNSSNCTLTYVQCITSITPR